MNKTLVFVIVAVLAVAIGFGGGYLVATRVADSGTASATGMPTDGRQSGGPFAQLTEEERQKLQTMTDEERQQFFEDKGIELPQGATPVGGPDGAGRMQRTTTIEGTVASASGEKLTIELADGGSATVYVDDDTLFAAASGKTADAAPGASVLVYAEPEAEGVIAAKTIVVK